MNWLIEFLQSEGTVLALIVMVPVIVALTDLVKKWGLSKTDATAPVVAIAWGIVLSILSLVANTYPDIAPWIAGVLLGVLAGLASSGLYKVVKNGRGSNARP